MGALLIGDIEFEFVHETQPRLGKFFLKAVALQAMARSRDSVRTEIGVVGHDGGTATAFSPRVISPYELATPRS